MSSSVPGRAGGPIRATTDLPYGPLPVRADQYAAAQSNVDPVSSVSGGGSHAFADRHDADPITATGAVSTGSEADLPHGAQSGTDHQSIEEREPEQSSELDIATARVETDDDVHFGVAAKALGVSRKTVERMVKRGQLDRGPSGAAATVSKRGLVTVLEQRRGDVGHPARATDVGHAQTGNAGFSVAWPQDVTLELQEILRPVLEPLLEDFVAARTRAAVLENQMESIGARAAKERARDELLLALATGGWRQRRKARMMALRHYALRDDVRP
jgi:hypothetical protein